MEITISSWSALIFMSASFITAIITIVQLRPEDIHIAHMINQHHHSNHYLTTYNNESIGVVSSPTFFPSSPCRSMYIFPASVAVSVTQSTNMNALKNFVGSIHVWEPGMNICVCNHGMSGQQLEEVALWFDVTVVEVNSTTALWQNCVMRVLDRHCKVLWFRVDTEIRRSLSDIVAYLEQDAYFILHAHKERESKVMPICKALHANDHFVIGMTQTAATKFGMLAYSVIAPRIVCTLNNITARVRAGVDWISKTVNTRPRVWSAQSTTFSLNAGPHGNDFPFTSLVLKKGDLKNKLLDPIIEADDARAPVLNGSRITVYYEKLNWFQRTLPFSKCDWCTWSSDPKIRNTADGLVYELRQGASSLSKNRDQVRIQYNAESFSRYREKSKMLSSDLSMSYDVNSDILSTYSPSPRALFTFRLFSWRFYNDRLKSKLPVHKLASAVVGVCHGSRETMLRALIGIGIVASYGACHHTDDIPEHLSLSNVKNELEGVPLPDTFNGWLWIDRERVAQKIALMKLHMFHLAFENSVEVGYVTEKVFTALIAGVIPVYIGSPVSIWWYVPANSVIMASDFRNAAELAAYLRRVATEPLLHEKHTSWRHGSQFRNMRLPPLLTESAALPASFCNVCRLIYRRKHPNMQRESVSVGGSVGLVEQNRSTAKLAQYNNSSSCLPSGPHRLAVVIPFREAPDAGKAGVIAFLPQLRHTTLSLRAYFASRGIESTIIVAHQSAGKLFNRAKLFNVGFNVLDRIDTRKLLPLRHLNHCHDYACFMDAEYVPRGGGNEYSYPDIAPIHPPSGYSCRGPSSFLGGGSFCASRSQLLESGGWPNCFEGYGGEDLAIVKRFETAGYTIYQPKDSLHQCYLDNAKSGHPTRNMDTNDRHLAMVRKMKYPWAPEDTVQGAIFNVTNVSQENGFIMVDVAI